MVSGVSGWIRIRMVSGGFGWFRVVSSFINNVVLCLSDASLVIADNCNALGLIPPPAR